MSQDEVAVDRGTLLQSGVPPQLLADGSVVWGYNAEYASDVEEGTGPHWVPIEPLLGWAKRVLGDESLGYAVQKSIAKYGTRPQPYIQPGIEAMRERLEREGVGKSITRRLRR